MKYSVRYKKTAERKLKKLDPSVRERIMMWVEKNLEGCENPRTRDKALEGEWEDYRRYRVGDYRLVADIQDDKIIILIVNVDKRNDLFINY